LGIRKPTGSNPVGKKRSIDMAAAEKGYCVKCKDKREMVKTKEVTMKNKRKALKGECVKCTTGMYKILGNK